MPRVEHPKPIKVHNSQNVTDRPKKNRLLREIEEYKAGDECLLLWKWVDDFVDKWRAKKKSSKSHNVSKSTLRQSKPTPSSSREARRVPKPAMVSVQAARRQTTSTEDSCEYQAQRRAPWGKLLHLYQNWKDQQAKKHAGRKTQRQGQKIAGNQATEHRHEPTRDRLANQAQPPQTTLSPPNQDCAAEHQPGIARKAVPVYNKKRGEVQKHSVQITQQPPIHNSVHLEHTPSNNYRAKHPESQKNKSARNTRFSDFLHEERHPASRETRRISNVLVEDDQPVRNSRFSSKLDPAKAVKKAREAEKAKWLKRCYICSSTNGPGGYRDHISRLWLCAACQLKENRGPKQCSCCGTPNSPNTTYADNGLWLCTNVSNRSDFFLPSLLP